MTGGQQRLTKLKFRVKTEKYLYYIVYKIKRRANHAFFRLELQDKDRYDEGTTKTERENEKGGNVMKNRKRMALAMAMAAGIGSVAGSGQGMQLGAVKVSAEEASGKEYEKYEIPEDWDISEPVTLSIYCIGDEGGIYADDMVDHINEIVKDRINATIEPIMISWGDYFQKLPIVWASGEDYDITYVASWCGYFTEGAKGPFYNLDELMPKYAPETYAEYSEMDNFLDSCLIDGSLYMVPCFSNEYGAHAIGYREDLRKKYGCPEIVDLETLETYLDTIKEKEPGMLPMNLDTVNNYLWYIFLNQNDWNRPVDHDNGIFVSDFVNTTEVFNVVETEEYEEFIKLMRRWYEKGYWSQSVMAETTAMQDQFLAGKSAVTLNNLPNLDQVYQKMQTSSPDWELGVFDWDSENAVAGYDPAGNASAIGANSKNPERAMMFLELCHQDEELHDALQYGIEGLTYVYNEDGTIGRPEGADASALAGKNYYMGLKDSRFEKDSENEWPMMKTIEEDWEARKELSPQFGFYLNQDEISAQLAAIKSVCDEYKLPLEKGLVDPETGLAELRQKLKEAGADELQEEINRQLKEYLASRK